ncbi:metallophosphoesterase [Clostridium chromiireducens]|uniref:Putative beta-lactamase HcpC n=1 Tax=Clostridium chromiireducens TaxID=225345 RepID=A0A1V4J0P1_9CLOT|nr:metallophosphoesterase [Clostridium chromiireducens]OPJ65746.1 putative beta-lactamase HcpC precursor [Clostridium chromiireducens]
MELRWLHLSDLHFKSNDYESKHLRKRLLKYLEKKKIECDFVAITGDIFYGYNYDKDYLSEMSEFVMSLIQKVNVKSHNLFIVPGNHDLDRDDYDRKMLIKAIKSEKKQYIAMNNIPDNNIQKLLGNHKYFYEFLEVINNEGCSHSNEAHYMVEREKFNILNLNTCLSYTEEYQDDLLICQSRLPEEIDKWEENSKINIALGHHVINMMEKTQREKLTHTFSESGIDIYLCGHVHEPDFDKLYDENDINVFVSGSNFIDDYSIPSFILNRIDLTNYKGYAELNVWDKREDFWKIAHTRKYNNGIREYSIKRLKKKFESIISESKEESAATSDIIPYNIKQTERDQQSIPMYNDRITEVNGKRVDFEMNTMTKIIKNIYWNSIDVVKKDEFVDLDTNNELFLKYSGLFKKATFNILKSSDQFNEIEVNLRQILILGNRIIKLLKEDSNYDLSLDVMDSLENLIKSQKTESTEEDIIREFIGFISKWIRYLSEVLCLSEVDSSINERATSLFLLKNTDDRDKGSRIDEVEKSCFVTISNINMYENSNIISEKDYYKIISKGLTTVLYSIYRNRNMIIEKTKNLIVNNIEDNEIRILLNMITDEQRKYLKTFKGRENYISEIYDQIVSNKFIALHGKEQSGKSSLLSKIAERMSMKTEGIGRYSGEITNVAPWITSVLYHSGKQSNDISEMMKSIVSQANARLIDKIHSERINSINYISCKRIIQEILSKLVSECGNAIIILDGIDNLVRNIDDFNFLPEDIPQNASIIISLRSDPDNIKWLKGHRDVKLIELKDIPRDEIPLLTNVLDEDNNGEGKSFNDNVWNRFSNKPGKIVEISNDTKLKDGKFSLVRLDTDENELFLEACEKWSDFEQEVKSISQEILILLSLFEPVCSLDIELIQSYFKNKNINHKLPFYRKVFIKVRSQVEGIDSYRVKLASRAFSEYVVNFYFSRVDIEEYIDSIFKWFSNDKSISTKIICQFMQYWRDSKRLSREFFQNKIDNFLDELKIKNESKFLFNISNIIFSDGLKMEDIATKCLDLCLLLDDKSIKIKYALRLIEGNGIKTNVEKGESILKELVSNDDPKALFILGRRLVLEKSINANKFEGKSYLIKSAELGYIKAKVFIGGILLDGDVIGKDYDMAFRYLEDAVRNDDIWAKTILGDALIYGYSGKQDRALGEKLLREACNLGNEKAKEILANRLINGYGLKQNLIEGEKLLRELVDEGSKDALINLAIRLLDGEGIEQNLDEGIKLLNMAYDQGSNDAKRLLANRLLDGRGIERDIVRGERLLRELVDNNDKEAKLNLANRLIDGSSIQKNQPEGESLLKELVDNNYTRAKNDYSNRLIDGDGILRNLILGEKILRDVAESGNVLANIILATRLVYGDGLSKNINEGICLLKNLSEEGIVKAQMELGTFIVEGKYNETYDGEGEELLRKAASSGNFEANLRLAKKLLGNGKIRKNINESERILMELTQKGYAEAGIFLGNELLSGYRLRKDKEHGEYLLRKFADSGYVLAKYHLGLRLIEGAGLKRDIKDGEMLLREAMGRGFVEAKYSLGEKLLDGECLCNNANEGRKLLYEAMNSGLIDAKLSIALRLLDGDGLDKDKENGEMLLKEVVDEGNEGARIILANRLIRGVGVDRDQRNGIKILRDMINQGNKRAKYILAITLLEGDGVPVDKREGELLLRELANDDYTKAKIELANRLIDGDHVEKNIDEAIKIFEELVDENNKEGKCEYAKKLIDEYGEVKDINKGIGIIKELVVEGYSEAKLILANELLEGNDILHDEDEGERLLREIAEENYKPAKLELGKRLIRGDRLNYDFEEGEKILRELIKEGNIMAANNLSQALLYDLNGNRNIEDALRILDEVIKQENTGSNSKSKKIEYARLHEILSEYYFLKSDNRSKMNGLKHLKAAARVEHPQAIYELGLRYIEGNGVKRSVSKGQKKFTKALNIGCAEAKYEIGRRLKYGIKYNRDEKLGDEYINEVISNSNGDKLRNIAFEYYKRKEFETATFLFDKAFEKGSVVAGNDLTYMLRRKEVKGIIRVNDIGILLKEGLRLKQRVNIINYALCYACGCQKQEDWHKADEIMASIDKINTVVSWWYELALNGDTEGDLIIGWLSRHRLIKDPNNLSVKQRMDIARRSGWRIPEWMDEIIYM